jgi:hypothetical protein
VLGAVAAGTLSLGGGCLGLGGGSGDEEKVEPRERLGAADPITVATDGDDLENAGAEVRWGAADAVARQLREAGLSSKGLTVGVGEVRWDEVEGASSDAYEDVWTAPFAAVFYTYDRDGNLIEEPDASFESLVAATPVEVESTVRYPEEERTELLPCVCERYWQQQE